jgi:hypothetical protein
VSILVFTFQRNKSIKKKTVSEIAQWETSTFTLNATNNNLKIANDNKCKLCQKFEETAQYLGGESVNRTQMNIKHKTRYIRNWKKHLFLDISSTNVDTLVPSF